MAHHRLRHRLSPFRKNTASRRSLVCSLAAKTPSVAEKGPRRAGPRPPPRRSKPTRASQPVGWAPHALSSTIQYMRIDHRRPHVGVAEELLHRPDIGPGFEQVRRKGMAKGVARHALPEPSATACVGHGPLDHRLMQMVPATNPLPVRGRVAGREHVPPRPTLTGPRNIV